MLAGSDRPVNYDLLFIFPDFNSVSLRILLRILLRSDSFFSADLPVNYDLLF
jgi:hypothetical protein